MVILFFISGFQVRLCWMEYLICYERGFLYIRLAVSFHFADKSGSISAFFISFSNVTLRECYCYVTSYFWEIWVSFGESWGRSECCPKNMIGWLTLLNSYTSSIALVHVNLTDVPCRKKTLNLTDKEYKDSAPVAYYRTIVDALPLHQWWHEY